MEYVRIKQIIGRKFAVTKDKKLINAYCVIIRPLKSKCLFTSCILAYLKRPGNKGRLCSRFFPKKRDGAFFACR